MYFVILPISSFCTVLIPSYPCLRLLFAILRMYRVYTLPVPVLYFLFSFFCLLGVCNSYIINIYFFCKKLIFFAFFKKSLYKHCQLIYRCCSLFLMQKILLCNIDHILCKIDHISTIYAYFYQSAAIILQILTLSFFEKSSKKIFFTKKNGILISDPEKSKY